MKELAQLTRELPVSAALQIDLAAKRRSRAGKQVISFCVGEPDAPTDDAAKLAGIEAIVTNNTRYTNAIGTPSLRRAIAHSLKRDYDLSYRETELAVTPGGKYAIHAALRALIDPADEVILPAPYWTSYLYSIRLAGGVPVVLPCSAESDFKLTPKQLEAAITPRTKALILNNPNNPSGAVYTREELTALAGVIERHDLFVIADEIYANYIYTAEPFCPLASVSEELRQRTITVNGLSKSHRMTGWRIGYIAANEALIRAVTAILSHTTGAPSTISQAAAEAALQADGTAFFDQLALYKRRRDLVIRELERDASLRFTRPDGAFYVMLDVRPYLSPACPNDTALALSLLETKGVSTVPCTDYGAPGYLRLAFPLDEADIVTGLGLIRDFLHEMVLTRKEEYHAE